MDINKRLFEFAEKRYGGVGKLQKKIEELSGKTQDIFRYVAGGKPNLATLENFQKAGCNINWLVTGSVYNTGEYPEYSPADDIVTQLKSEIEIQKRINENYAKVLSEMLYNLTTHVSAEISEMKTKIENMQNNMPK